jgi:hypothetical protein
MKKQLLILYLLLVTAVSITIGLFFRTNSLQHQLNKIDNQQSTEQAKIAIFNKMMRIDSLLIRGDYNKALAQYKALSDNNENDTLGIRLRIQMTENFKRLDFAYSTQLETMAEEDSLAEPESVAPKVIQQYDSLSFAHEKAKIQVVRLQKLVQQKSSGQYLRFKSKKGNQLHYVGEVKDNKANGIGIALLDTGSRYEGEWYNNLRHGKGAFYWPDGEHYEGSYENDKRNGLGTYFWPNGEKYIGFWEDDKRNGHGEFYGADGTILTTGTWANDKLIQTDKKEKRAGR